MERVGEGWVRRVIRRSLAENSERDPARLVQPEHRGVGWAWIVRSHAGHEQDSSRDRHAVGDAREGSEVPAEGQVPLLEANDAADLVGGAGAETHVDYVLFGVPRQTPAVGDLLSDLGGQGQLS